MKRLICYLMLFCIAWLPIQAEEGGFFSDNQSFDTMQHILVLTFIQPSDLHSTFYETLLSKFPEQIAHKLERKKWHVTTYADSSFSSQPIKEWIRHLVEQKHATETYLQTPLGKQIAAKYDAILIAQPVNISSRQQQIPGYVNYDPITYHIPIYNKDGNVIGYQSYIRYESHYVPPQLVHYGEVAVVYTLINAKTGTLIARHAYLKNGTLSLTDLLRKTAGAYASALDEHRHERKKR